MYQVKDLTQLTVTDLLKEVKSEEEWWGGINKRILGMVKLILESSLEEELLEFLQASRYVRTECRRGYRNGYYERSLYSQYGVIKALRIPRALRCCVIAALTLWLRRYAVFGRRRSWSTVRPSKMVFIMTLTWMSQFDRTISSG